MMTPINQPQFSKHIQLIIKFLSLEKDDLGGKWGSVKTQFWLGVTLDASNNDKIT